MLTDHCHTSLEINSHISSLRNGKHFDRVLFKSSMWSSFDLLQRSACFWCRCIHFYCLIFQLQQIEQKIKFKKKTEPAQYIIYAFITRIRNRKNTSWYSFVYCLSDWTHTRKTKNNRVLSWAFSRCTRFHFCVCVCVCASVFLINFQKQLFQLPNEFNLLQDRHTLRGRDRNVQASNKT